MSKLTRVPLTLIAPPTSSGQIVAQGTSLGVEPLPDVGEVLDGQYDSVNGILTMDIPGVGRVSVGGFLTENRSVVSIPGRDGENGSNGRDGMRGKDGGRGCRGPQGKVGSPGKRGPRGLDGPQGPTGPTGLQGIKGEDGRVKIFIQSEDPGAVGAGSLWMVP